ncbi:DUF2252 domain-containing protein [Aquipuribacter sp. MA13-6]|uniref:DUF2252 domain-containing protein n=1 Tax=unclassified Aquipuribacter TaxID=2635084 RepID=UPI003EEA6818
MTRAVPTTTGSTDLAGRDAATLGRSLRGTLRRSDHAALRLPERDPVAVLEQQNADRLPDLVGVRIGRMLESPFAMYRGSAAVMAHDLTAGPDTGRRVVACGDAHVANFGLFASPERRLLFDLNDFDEAWTAPWEWDVKRLAGSVVVAGRDAGLPEAVGKEATGAAVRSYRETLRALASRSVVERFWFQVEADWLVERAKGDGRKLLQSHAARARRRTSEQVLGRLGVVDADGRTRIREDPPLTRRVPQVSHEDMAEHYARYRRSTRQDVQLLLSQMRPVDHVLRVVGVGSVGTRCLLLLCQGPSDEPLFLQVKQAQPSVLATYGKQPYDLPIGRTTPGVGRDGRRVVAAQRVLQAQSDPFLGWSGVSADEVPGGRALDFYWRQLRDMKGSVDTRGLSASLFQAYAGLCGTLLARAHAQSPACPVVAAYLGNAETFDDAVTRWAVAYADQVEADHAAVGAAVKAGRLPCETGV